MFIFIYKWLKRPFCYLCAGPKDRPLTAVPRHTDDELVGGKTALESL